MNGDPHHPFRVRLDQQADQIEKLEAIIAERDVTIGTLRQLLHRSYGRIRWYRLSRNQWRQRNGGDGYATAVQNLQNSTTAGGGTVQPTTTQEHTMTTETTTTTETETVTQPDPLPLETTTPPDDDQAEPDDDDSSDE